MRRSILSRYILTLSLMAGAPAEVLAQTRPSVATDDVSAGVLVFMPETFAWARPNTALEMVTRIPGFSVDNGDQRRGLSGTAGNLLVNGRRPATKSEQGSAVLARIPADQVLRIELIQGGAPGIDMQGFSVVANVIVASATSRLQQTVQWHTVAREGSGPLFGGRYEAELRRGDHVFSVVAVDGTSTNDRQGVARVDRIETSGPTTRIREDTEVGGGSHALQLGYGGPVAGGRLESTAAYGVFDFASLTSASSTDRERSSQSFRGGADYATGMTYTHPLGGLWGFEGRLIRSGSDEDGLALDQSINGGVAAPEQRFTYDRESSETIGRGVFRRERGESVGWEFGGEIALNTLDSSQSFRIGGVSVPLPSASIMVEEVRGEVFALANWKVRPDLVVEAGALLESSRLTQSGDASAETRLTYLKPRMLATWTPSAGDQFHLRLEREVSQLDFNDFAASVDLANDDTFGGNVDLKPENRWIAEARWERRFMETGALTATLRHDTISDVIDIIPVGPNLSGVGNIGDGRSTSVEASLTMPRDFLGLTGSRIRIDVRRQWTSVIDPTSGQSREISYTQPLTGSVDFQQDLSRWNTLWGFTYNLGASSHQYDPDATRRDDSDGYVTAFVEYKPDPTLSLRLSVASWLSLRTERTTYDDRVSRDVALFERRETDTDTFFRVQLRKRL